MDWLSKMEMFSINRKLLLTGYTLCAEMEAVGARRRGCHSASIGRTDGQHATGVGRMSKTRLKKAGGKGRCTVPYTSAHFKQKSGSPQVKHGLASAAAGWGEARTACVHSEAGLVYCHTN